MHSHSDPTWFSHLFSYVPHFNCNTNLCFLIQRLRSLCKEDGPSLPMGKQLCRRVKPEILCSFHCEYYTITLFMVKRHKQFNKLNGRLCWIVICIYTVETNEVFCCFSDMTSERKNLPWFYWPFLIEIPFCLPCLKPEVSTQYMSANFDRQTVSPAWNCDIGSRWFAGGQMNFTWLQIEHLYAY